MLDELKGDRESALIGRRIGEYRIDSFIAQGGMSMVFQASRADGKFERDVAIKLSPRNRFEPNLGRRFIEEQRILAELTHPNISQLFDAFVTEEGWPCIVMELIDGDDIVSYCNRNAIRMLDRLEMLKQVVEATAFAHSRLIVHRDIKVSNVMVTSAGVPKLLDFGIARQLTADKTQTQHRPMTPRYASPEQLTEKPETVASDIYQMGLLIFEVLTGHCPTENESYSDSLSRAVHSRPLTLPEQHTRDLPREIRLIIEQCLRPEPEDRYADMGELRRDLELYLAGYPVRAGGQSRMYRLRKFIGRNRFTSGITLAALVAITASTAYYTWAVTEQRDEADRQRGIAEESLRFLENFFNAAEPDLAQGRELTAKEVLVQGERRIETELAEQPAIKARLHYQLARIHYRLYDYEAAERNVLKAIAIDEADTGLSLDDRIDIENLYANMLAERGDLQRSREIARQLIERATEEFGRNDDLTLILLNNLAITESDLGNSQASREILEDIYQRRLIHQPENVESLLTIALNLIATYFREGQLDKAIDLGRRSLDQVQRDLGENHSLSVQLLSNIGESLLRRDGLQAALPIFQQQAQRAAAVFGKTSAPFHYAQENIAVAEVFAGDAQVWIPRFEHAIKTTRDAHGEDEGIWRSETMLAWGYLRVGRYSEARQLLDELLPKQLDLMGPSHTDTLTTRVVTARLLWFTQDPDAQSYCQETADAITEAYGDGHFLLDDLRELDSFTQKPVRASDAGERQPVCKGAA